MESFVIFIYKAIAIVIYPIIGTRLLGNAIVLSSNEYHIVQWIVRGGKRFGDSQIVVKALPDSLSRHRETTGLRLQCIISRNRNGESIWRNSFDSIGAIIRRRP